jgi:hypothetical protein
VGPGIVHPLNAIENAREPSQERPKRNEERDLLFSPPPKRTLTAREREREREREGEGEGEDERRRKRICTMPGNQNGGGSLNGMRPMKTDTIHGCARNGYFHGVKRMLQENPSLLNARDSVVFPPFF